MIQCQWTVGGGHADWSGVHSHVNIAPAGPETAQKHGQDTSRGSPWLRSPGGFSWNLSSLFFFQRFTTVLALEADYRHRVESKEGFSCRARFHGSTNADLASERAPLDSRSGPDFPKEMCSLSNIQLPWVLDRHKLTVFYLNSFAMDSVQVGKAVFVK